ncbi:preprotein translocase subunit SecG [Erythrobacter sp.]|uniref:preprotein translocase subunit SecG n=1 Tax=Erythrobacter sp. TaxID=1042 RepID=UPI001425BCC0|nr:preprotein translocase subunit SecG [Erythrobacter sp.]QIQ86020.1 MAG: preprotein translocase subunit SecG [Erythrobacter sp.]
MSLFFFLTVVQAIVSAALVGVVLMQRSEGGGLGIGGSPGGALGARGAADFLTRATKWLAIVFVALSIALAAVAVETQSVSEISTTLERGAPASRTDDLLGTGEAPAQDAPLAEPATQDGAAAPVDDDAPLAE